MTSACQLWTRGLGAMSASKQISRLSILQLTRYDRNCTKLPHGACVGQYDAIHEAPADVGQRHVPKHLCRGGHIFHAMAYTPFAYAHRGASGMHNVPDKMHQHLRRVSAHSHKELAGRRLSAPFRHAAACQHCRSAAAPTFVVAGH